MPRNSAPRQLRVAYAIGGATAEVTPDRELVLIMGAGLAGLLTAHGLRQKKIGFHIYEALPSLPSEKSRYRTLKLSEAAVQGIHELLDVDTMREATNIIRKIVFPSLETYRMDKTQQRGDEVLELGSNEGMYTADYAALQCMLIERLGSQHISYGRHVNNITCPSESVVAWPYAIAHVEDQRVQARFIVGAGGHSMSQWLKHYKLTPDKAQKWTRTEARRVFGKMPLEFMTTFRVCGGPDEIRYKVLTPGREMTLGVKLIASPTEHYLAWDLIWRQRRGEIALGYHRQTRPIIDHLLALVDWPGDMREALCYTVDGHGAFVTACDTLGPSLSMWRPQINFTYVGNAVHQVAIDQESADEATVRGVVQLCTRLNRNRYTTFHAHDRLVRDYEVELLKDTAELMQADWRLLEDHRCV